MSAPYPDQNQNAYPNPAYQQPNMQSPYRAAAGRGGFRGPGPGFPDFLGNRAPVGVIFDPVWAKTLESGQKHPQSLKISSLSEKIGELSTLWS